MKYFKKSFTLTFLIIVLFVSQAIYSINLSSNSTSLSEWTMDGRTLNANYYYPGDIPGDISSLTVRSTTLSGSTSDPIIANGFLYGVPLRDGIYKLNASNVSQTLDQSSDDQLFQYPIPSFASGFVYAANEYGTVYQYNASNLSQTISTNTQSNAQHYSSPIVYQDFTYFTDWHSTGGNYIFQANASNITQVLNSYSVSGCEGGPAIANGYLYHACNSRLYQFNATNVSSKIAEFSTGSSFSTGNGPAVTNNYVYVGVDSGTVYQLDASDVSNQVASFSTGGAVRATPAVAHGYVYVGSADGFTYQLNATNISIQVANFSTGTVNKGLTVTDEYLLVGGNRVYQLDAFNISTHISNYSMSSPGNPVVVDGIIYVASGSSYYQLGTGLPVTSLRVPVNTYELSVSKENVTFTCSSYGANGLSNVSLYLTNKSNANFIVNQTTNITGNSNLTSWIRELEIGSYTWNCLTYDTLGNNDWSSNRTIIIDNTAPTITISTPSNWLNTTDINLDINYTPTDPILDSCWYFNGTANNTLASCANVTSVTWGEANHSITVYANDTLGNIGSSQINFTIDLSAPVFTNFTNITIGENRALSYDINASDVVGIDCFSVNNTNFTIDCNGILQNNTLLSTGLYDLNITVNDTLGNTRSGLMSVNVTLVGLIGLELISPLTLTNVTQNTLFNVTVNVSCTRSDCDNVNLTISAYYGNTSDVDIAFICYSSSCTDADDITTYLTNEGFGLTGNRYSSWTDATLNSTAFDLIVCGGYYLSCNYGFDNAADPGRDAYENEQIPLLSISHYAYVPYYLGITSSVGTYDSSENNILNISSHNIMSGFSGTVAIDTSADDIGYLTLAQMTDPYTKLFAYEDGGGDEISGFALDSGQATVGTNPQNLVHLGFNTNDAYPYTTGNDSEIIKQAACWAATGTYDCVPKNEISNSSSTTPFYALSNPLNVSLNINDSILITFQVNATGNVDTYEFIVDALRTNDVLVTNTTQRTNISIVLANDAPIISITNPNNNTHTTNTTLDVLYTATGDVDSCWYNPNNGTGDISLSNCANITSVLWSEGNHTITIFSNSTTNSTSNESIFFTIDTTNPILSITSPVNGSYSSDNNLNITFNISDLNLDSCSYFNGTSNTTLLNCTNISTQTWSDGVKEIIIYANDSAGNSISKEINFTIDTTQPNTTLLSPAANYVDNSVGTTSLFFNCSITDTLGLRNISLYITNSSNLSFSRYNSKNISGTSQISNWTLTLANGNYTWNCLSFDLLNHSSWGSNRSFIINTSPDADNDGISDGQDPLLYNESNVTTTGVDRLNITVSGNRTNESYSGVQEINFYDSSTLLINFSHNFNQSTLNLSKVRITKTTTSLIVNLSDQLQGNKTLYIADNSFVSLCVKDASVSSINEISSGCNGLNETDFTTCLGGNLTSNNITCTDLGSVIKLENLKHSAIRGTQASSSSSSGGSSGNGAKCVSNWKCSEWSVCSSGKQIRSCEDIQCNNNFNRPIEVKTCSTCTESWKCGEWSSCSEEGLQSRSCTETNRCGTSFFKPQLEKICNYKSEDVNFFKVLENDTVNIDIESDLDSPEIKISTLTRLFWFILSIIGFFILF